MLPWFILKNVQNLYIRLEEFKASSFKTCWAKIVALGWATGLLLEHIINCDIMLTLHGHLCSIVGGETKVITWFLYIKLKVIGKIFRIPIVDYITIFPIYFTIIMHLICD